VTRNSTRWLVVAAMLLTLLAGCASGAKLPLKYEIGLFETDEDAMVWMAVSNEGKESVPLRFRTSQRHDFVVRRGKEEVWRWSADQAFLTVVEEEELEPGRSYVFSELLPELPPGDYVVEGYFLAEGLKGPVVKTNWTVR